MGLNPCELNGYALAQLVMQVHNLHRVNYWDVHFLEHIAQTLLGSSPRTLMPPYKPCFYNIDIN